MQEHDNQQLLRQKKMQMRVLPGTAAHKRGRSPLFDVLKSAMVTVDHPISAALVRCLISLSAAESAVIN